MKCKQDGQDGQTVEMHRTNYTFIAKISEQKLKLQLYVYTNQLQICYYSKHLQLKNMIGKQDSQTLMNKLFNSLYSEQNCQINYKNGTIRLTLPNNNKCIRIQFKLDLTQLQLQRKVQLQLKRQEIKILEVQQKNNSKIKQLSNKIAYLKNMVKKQQQGKGNKQKKSTQMFQIEKQMAKPKKKAKVEKIIICENKDGIKQKECKKQATLISSEQLAATQKLGTVNKPMQSKLNNSKGFTEGKPIKQSNDRVDESVWKVGPQSINSFMQTNKMIRYVKEGVWSQIYLDLPIKRQQANQQFTFRVVKSKESRIMIGVVCKSMLNSVSSYSSGKAVGYRGYDKCIRFSSLQCKMGNGFKQGDEVTIVIDWMFTVIMWKVNGNVSGQKPLNNLQQEQLYPYVEMYNKDDIIEWV